MQGLEEFCQACQDLWHYGWVEGSGGNVSLRVNEPSFINGNTNSVPLGFSLPLLANTCFLISGSGKRIKNIPKNPEENSALIKISAKGDAYNVLWGKSKPTSELATHLKCQAQRLLISPEQKVILHAHPANIIAMTFTEPLEDSAFTQKLWSMITECSIIFPDGLALLPWMLAGTNELGEASANCMKRARVVIWAHHGVLVAANDCDGAFVLLETVEKAAQIYMSIKDKELLQKISKEQIQEIEQGFGLSLGPNLL